MKHRILTGLVFIVSASFGFQSFAMDGRAVIEKMHQAYYYQGIDQRAHAHMRIIDKQGRERTRDVIFLRRNLDPQTGEQRYYAYFTGPSDIRKTAFIAWKNKNKDDDRWLYLPALDLVKRIAASDERTSFVGSHFFYEDVSGRNIDDDTHQIIEENEEHYVIESKPKAPEKVEFLRYVSRIDKQSFLPAKIEYYGNNENAYRIYDTLKTKNIEGYMTITSAQMEDKQTLGKTIVNYSAIKYSQDIPENVFSERYLRRPPKQYFE
ncbi:MAG: outer membrane lipoprotein-sorting protein [Gammaproteobacteria bacterium]|nr:outer membrane lipoprotein-sorting protein [Gammaproteobacteria bacterium]